MQTAEPIPGAEQRIVDMFNPIATPKARYNVARVYAFRGDHDLAFEWLTKVENIPPWFLAYDVYLRFMVDDPRWEPWLGSLDWPWEYEL